MLWTSFHINDKIISQFYVITCNIKQFYTFQSFFSIFTVVLGLLYEFYGAYLRNEIISHSRYELSRIMNGMALWSGEYCDLFHFSIIRFLHIVNKKMG